MSGARRRLRAGRCAALVAAVMLLGAWTAAADAPAPPSAVERLRAAVALHPSDPDLRFALARELARAGDAAGALDHARVFLARWPDRRADARIELAAALLDGAAPGAATTLLDEAIERAPDEAMPRFYRGIAYRASGRVEAANREFRRAGELEPALLAETLLARALGLFDLGRDDEALVLLREIVATDPTSDTALRARLLLRQRELPGQGRRFRVDAYAGIEYDDNVTLENAENTIAASGRDDFRWVWGAGASLHALRTERARLTVGYRYDQTSHTDLGNFDVLGNTVFASGVYALRDDLVLRLDGIFGNTLQDLGNELIGGSIRPNLIYSLGPKRGAVRAFAQVEFSEYDEVPSALQSPWERDAITTSVGAEYFLPRALDESWIAVSGAWSHSRTQARSLGEFDGDFDYDAWRLRAATALTLPCDVRLDLDASYTHDRYHNDNYAYHVATGFTGFRKRRDDIMSGRIALSREIVGPVRLEIYWRGARRVSNVDVFDYDKQVAGAVLRVAID